MASNLKTWSNDVDTVAALNEDDATLLLKEVYGYDDDDLEGNNWYELSPYEYVTVTWLDGDFNPGRAGIEFPERCQIEFVAIYKTPYSNTLRFVLDDVSIRDGYIRVRSEAREWAKLGRRIIASKEV